MENSVLLLIVSLEVFFLGFFAGKWKDYMERNKFNKNYDNMIYKIKILERDNKYLKNKLLLKDRTL